MPGRSSAVNRIPFREKAPEALETVTPAQLAVFWRRPVRALKIVLFSHVGIADEGDAPVHDSSSARMNWLFSFRRAMTAPG